MSPYYSTGFVAVSLLQTKEVEPYSICLYFYEVLSRFWKLLWSLTCAIITKKNALDIERIIVMSQAGAASPEYPEGSYQKVLAIPG